jgi:hypothetical protein
MRGTDPRTDYETPDDLITAGEALDPRSSDDMIDTSSSEEASPTGGAA